MKADKQLTEFENMIVELRAYDDDVSIIIRLRLIKELNMQIKNILVMNHNKSKVKK